MSLKWIILGQKLGHRSNLRKTLEKPCVHSKGHIFSQIFIKLAKNIYLNKISDKFENVSCRVKIEVTSSNLKENFCTLL